MANNSRLARLIDLVPFITSHQGISIAELARKFGVSIAEIEKDLWLLYMCGLPGQTPLELMEFEFEDGFVTVRNAEELKAPRSLTQIELATLIIGLEILHERGSEQAKNLRDRLSSLLRTSIKFEPSVTDRYLPEINKAIGQNLVLQITYVGKEREVIPFETYNENGEIYLRAFCKSANANRTFRISKIGELALLSKHELAPNSVPSESNVQTTRIKVHRDARLVKETLGSVETVSFYSKDWLFSQVLALGGAVELLDSQLKTELLNRVQASQNLYL